MKKALPRILKDKSMGVPDPKKQRYVGFSGKIMENPNSGFQVDEFKVVYIPERTNICTLNKTAMFEYDDVPFPVQAWWDMWSFPGGKSTIQITRYGTRYG